MSETPSSNSPLDARLQAAEWHARLAGAQVSAEDVRAFGLWLEDPENARAWAETQSVWAKAGELAEDAEIQALTRQALHRPRGKRPDLRLVALGAVAVAATVVTVAALGWSMRGEDYVSPGPEVRRLALDDGSTLVLDAASGARVRMAASTRTIELREGRAYFDVAHDDGRAFTVRAGELTVTALGTRFDVALGAGEVLVTLYEGRVALSRDGETLTLEPGERAVASEDGLVRSPMDGEVEVGWIEGRLVFRDAPLGEAVAEMNRYFDRPVRLSPELETRRVSGVFTAGDRAGFLSALTAMLPARARTDEGGATVLSAAP